MEKRHLNVEKDISIKTEKMIWNGIEVEREKESRRL